MQIGKMLVRFGDARRHQLWLDGGACNCEYVLLGVHRENLNGFAD